MSTEPVEIPVTLSISGQIDFDLYRGDFQSSEDFYNTRDHIAGLLLLPADVNRSFQKKSFVEKAPHYAKQNLYTGEFDRKCIPASAAI